MDNKIPPAKAEKPLQTPEITPPPSGLRKFLVPFLVAVILVLAAALIFLYQRFTTSPITTTQPAQKITDIPKPTESTPVTADWKTYTNAEAGFSLKYPASVLLEAETKEATQSVLSVSAEKLSGIAEDLPSFMGRNDALKEKARLATGGGEAAIKIGSLYGNLGMKLSQFEVCSVILTRSLTFYPGDYRVIISLAGPQKAIMDSMPDFFTVDGANCGTNRVWNRDKITSFEQTLADKKGRGAGQQWYDTFDAIVKTVTLKTPTSTTAATKTVPSDWLTYKNLAYGFEISYPKSYKALDSKTDLYGYPQGAVLLYGGGQAYDVVVEVWNTQSGYKDKYATRLSDVTVVNYKDKYITLLDNTSSAENKEIISSFKLTP